MVRKSEFIHQLLKFLDVFLTGVAFIITYLLKKYALPSPFGGLIHTPNYYVLFLMILIIWRLSFSYFRIHENRSKGRYSHYMVEMSKIIMINVGILILILFALRIRDISRLMIAMFLIFDWSFLIASGWIIYRIREGRRRQGAFASLVLMIGTKLAAKECIERIHRNPDENYRVIGCLTLNPSLVGQEVTDGVKVIGTVEELENILTNEVVDEIIFSIPTDRIPAVEKYLVMAESTGIKIRILPHWHFRQFLSHRPKFYSMYFEEFSEVPTLVFAGRSASHKALFAKRVFDLCMAFSALILVLPLMIVISIVIKLVSPEGPILFAQERLGLYGRRFTLYKFRTMVTNAGRMSPEMSHLNEVDGPAFKIKNDPRVIPYVGRLLRKTGLDELPQLFNVLRGEMSLVGPRPPLAEEVDQYELWERRRLSMKPGITCLWQLQPDRNRIPFRTWMKMDLDYIDNWSLWLDSKIILKTVKTVFAGYGM
ncbi:MAG: sugar transferase [Deltaproteobacteria bacterium]|nr:sugar transferase [Deltaproteobacteria bacterium]